MGIDAARVPLGTLTDSAGNRGKPATAFARGYPVERFARTRGSRKVADLRVYSGLEAVTKPTQQTKPVKCAYDSGGWQASEPLSFTARVRSRRSGGASVGRADQTWDTTELACHLGELHGHPGAVRLS